METDGRAGLTVRIDEAHHYDLEISGGTARVWARIGPLRQSVAERAVPAGPVDVAVTARSADPLPPTVTSAEQFARRPGPLGIRAAGPDTITFTVDAGDGPAVLAALDGRYLSTEVAAGFTGRVIGMYVTEGTAAFDWFDYRALPVASM